MSISVSQQQMKHLLPTLILWMGSCAICTYAQEEMTDTLREVVVTGTGTQHLLKNAPVQTEVISRKMLDSYGGKSIEEILGGLTASFAFSEGDMGSQMQLGGLGNSYILILVDGKRIHGDVGGENDLGLIDPHNIERIEIVKGAQSALYGSDAMAGVINIITRRLQAPSLLPQGGEIDKRSHRPLLGGMRGAFENTTRYGSYNDVRQHNSVAFALGKFTSTTNFQLQHTDGWQNTADEFTEAMVVHDSRTKTVNKYTNWQVAERLTYDFSKAFSMYADGTYYIKHINRPKDGKYASCDVYTYDLMYRNASASLGGKINLNSSKPEAALPHGGAGSGAGNITFDIDWNKHAYYYDYTARTYEYMKLVGEQYGEQNGEWFSVPYYPGDKNLQSDQQRVMAQTKGVFNLPYENMLSVGAEYRYDYLKAPNRTDNGTASDWTGAVYVQDEFNLVSWFNLTAGLRLVENANFGFRATPKVSTMFSLGDFRLRFGWGQGFKTPTVKELHYRYLHVMGSSTFFNIGNEALNPQTSNYWSGGIEYRGRKLTISATPYYNSLDNMITLVNVPVGEIPAGVTTAYLGDGSGDVVARMYKNMEDAKTYGVDFNFNLNINANWTVGGNYSYLDTKAHLYNSSKNRLDEVKIDGMAHHKWNAFVTWNQRFCPTYKLGVNFSTRGSSKRFYQNNGDGKPFLLWRINTTHDFGRTERPLSYRVEFGVDNIFNYRDTTMHPYHLGTTNAGTTLFATFSIKFKQGKSIKSKSIISKKSQENEED